jgi:hypothetical protein
MRPRYRYRRKAITQPSTADVTALDEMQASASARPAPASLLRLWENQQ